MSALLEAEDVTVRFGGLVALDRVSLTVPEGSIVGLIGPNGAGKSTWFGVLSGLLRPKQGRVAIDGTDMTRASPQRRARAGMARTFQRAEIFSSLSVREHLVLAHRSRSGNVATRLVLDVVGLGRRPRAGEDEAVDAIIEQLGLRPVQSARAGSLPLGTGRLVELGRALATRPRVLLLDEPSSGLDADETAALTETLRTVRVEQGTAMLLVEHNVEMVLGLADRVTVLDFGKVIAEGTPPEVASSDVVQAAYLGDGTVTSAGIGVGVRLEVEGVTVAYDGARALFGVGFTLEPGRSVAVLGANGAGKSSLAAAIAGAVPVQGGRILVDGADVTRWPAHRRARAGVAFVPEGRGIFRHLTVHDNLRAMLRNAVPPAERAGALERAMDVFPVLGERRRQAAGTLSGGEQQMLALARVLVAPPKLLVADEMSLGLAPRMVDVVFEALGRAREAGVTIVLVEQYVERALAFADTAVLLRQGDVAWSGPSDEAGAVVRSSYLGT